MRKQQFSTTCALLLYLVINSFAASQRHNSIRGATVTKIAPVAEETEQNEAIPPADIQPPLIALLYNYQQLVTTGEAVQQGEASVWVENARTIRSQTLDYYIEGMPPFATFQIIIAQGMTCDQGADAIGGAYWNADQLEADPWVDVSIGAADAEGVISGVLSFSNGYSLDGNFGHALVVFDAVYGVRVACGVLLYNIPLDNAVTDTVEAA
mmetsp:Transcript_23140/g.35701  ORF Transcript_23140/g.35701 Transcript_23140/m.35701 type:complete len:210 (+) Transcript_23140:398-1027(+)|eukprot:CAMPEP_0196822090 /NCGR_PEP_ID=MMETSP1362-20130617/82107_1 /TAXON_ID=163516 /ORGANISM="Leptocylindrus danicus, Strain CCMP1856" /LENGTH=209 /DNA_ID=CAMNT_0042201539 /DNA_START=393 /DNA_END=1022 /DNA_ORIENTATION=+